jgi:hypothetical protein
MYGENSEVEYRGDMKNAYKTTRDYKADKKNHYFPYLRPEDLLNDGIKEENLFP